MENYIAYNGGCNIWVTEKFDNSIDWHKGEFQGTKEECNDICNEEMRQANKSYNDNDYLIG